MCPIYYNFRASLKHAVILLHEKKSVLLSRYNVLLNLTRLEYYNYINYHVTIYQLQVSCPTFASIKFASDYKAPQFLAEDNTFYNLSNLSELGFSVPRLSSSYVDLIVEHLPRSVKKLVIKINDIDLYDWIDEVGIERVLKLADRMSKLSYATPDCIPSKEYKRESENKEESTMITFFKILKGFKGNKKRFCSAHFSDFVSADSAMNFGDNLLLLDYGLKFKDNQNESETSTINLALPDKSVSIIGPEIINSLVFFICSGNDGFAYELLKYRLVNCPHLQYVEYQDMNYPNHKFQLSNSNSNYFNRGELTGYPNESTTTQENIKDINPGGFIPSSDFLI